MRVTHTSLTCQCCKENQWSNVNSDCQSMSNEPFCHESVRFRCVVEPGGNQNGGFRGKSGWKQLPLQRVERGDEVCRRGDHHSSPVFRGAASRPGNQSCPLFQSAVSGAPLSHA